MTYTEYVQENLAKLTGGINTGTGVTALYEENLIPAFSSSNLHYENEAVMCLGAGGVYATAEDVANFGTGFFAGNEVILSENSKNEMAIRVSIDEYSDGSTERGRKLRSAISEKFHFASLEFQTLDGIVEAIGMNECKLCTYCWNGKE